MTSCLWFHGVLRAICGISHNDELSVVSVSMTSYLWYQSVWRVICGISQYDELSVISCRMTSYLWHHAVWRVICGIMLYDELSVVSVSMTSYLCYRSDAVWRVICGIVQYDELSVVSCSMMSYLLYQSLWRVICFISHYKELLCGIMRYEGLPVTSRCLESQTVVLCGKKTYLWCQLASRVLGGNIRHEKLKWYHVIWRIVWSIAQHDVLFYHSLPRVNLRNQMIWRNIRWYQSVRRVTCHAMQCGIMQYLEVVRWRHVNMSQGLQACISQKQKVLLELRLELSRI